MTQANPATAYRRNAILNASPEKLVLLMYDGAIRHLETARQELDTPGQSHTSLVGMSLGKAMAIIGELRTCIDADKGGAIAQDLDRLYDFCLDGIYNANLERKSSHVEPPLRVMKTLKEGWDAIVPN